MGFLLSSQSCITSLLNVYGLASFGYENRQQRPVRPSVQACQNSTSFRVLSQQEKVNSLLHQFLNWTQRIQATVGIVESCTHLTQAFVLYVNTALLSFVPSVCEVLKELADCSKIHSQTFRAEAYWPLPTRVATLFPSHHRVRTPSLRSPFQILNHLITSSTQPLVSPLRSKVTSRLTRHVHTITSNPIPLLYPHHSLHKVPLLT